MKEIKVGDWVRLFNERSCLHLKIRYVCGTYFDIAERKIWYFMSINVNGDGRTRFDREHLKTF